VLEVKKEEEIDKEASTYNDKMKKKINHSSRHLQVEVETVELIFDDDVYVAGILGFQALCLFHNGRIVHSRTLK
jgi:hypothetical protein